MGATCRDADDIAPVTYIALAVFVPARSDYRPVGFEADGVVTPGRDGHYSTPVDDGGLAPLIGSRSRQRSVGPEPDGVEVACCDGNHVMPTSHVALAVPAVAFGHNRGLCPFLWCKFPRVIPARS